jgi:alkyldihydroxyacetonephosphate synthase
VSRPTQPYPDISWSAWGDPDQATPVSPQLNELLRTALGVERAGPKVPEIGDLLLPAPKLPAASLERLGAGVGSGHLSTADEARVRHMRGKSTPDLLRLRRGDVSDAPDAVLEPGSHDEVLEVLRICTEDRIAVVPFGGGTTVVGGLEPRHEGFAGVIALDLRRLNALVAVDDESRIATLEPGLRGPEAEALLAEHGFTIGHFPQSFLYATIGGFAAARSSGQASAGYGRFDERVVGLRVATPRGTLELGRAPKSAAGPDLRQLLLGSEGALGVLTAITVEVRPVPEARVYEGWRFADFTTGAAALRRLVQDGPVPTVLRLSDEVETALNLARPTELSGEGEAEPAGPSGGCLAITGYEGTAGEVAARREAVSDLLRALGAEPDPAAGATWEHGRYHGPYLRDSLLDAGALVETLETTTFWSGIPRLYEAVREALTTSLAAQGTNAVVMCHISHVYPSGASLYFTVACAQREDPVEQWWTAKAATSDAIIAAGGSITHHHGIGVDHRAWYEQQIGPLGVAALQAVKRELDPAGILNPGVLLP